MIRIVLATRATGWAVLATAVLAVVTYAAGTWTLEIAIFQATPNELVVSDLCGLACATVVAIVMRPRMWEWERAAGGSRARLVAASAALAGLVLPALCAAAVIPQVAGKVDWAFAITNVLALAAIVQLAAPVTGPLAAGVMTAVIWYGSGIVQNLRPEAVTYLPISGYPAGDPRVVAMAVLVAIALIVQVRTLGTTARRRSDD